VTFKKPIYRILFFAAWIVVLGGIVTLLIAANKRNKEHVCKGVDVTINGGGDKIYIEKEDVIKSIDKTANGSLINRNITDINLTLLEKVLEENPWIRDAELYFDTKEILHVSVSEREPVARIFTTNGNSFYMDSAGYIMPLLENYSAKLPVVTGFTPAKRWNANDSVVWRGVKEIVQFVGPHPFWNAQVGQIDITPVGKFELVPVIGSHIIRLGTAENIEAKLNKLFVFYTQVLPKAGFAKYGVLDVQFDGQVVAVKKGPQSPVDSIQLQKNIQELIQKKAMEQEAQAVLQQESLPIAITPVVIVNKDSINIQPSKKDAMVSKDKAVNDPTPKKATEVRSNPVKPKE